MNDTTNVVSGNLYSNYENNISIQIDSILNDSRCPPNAMCIWEGNVAVRFYFVNGIEYRKIVLNTATMYLKDTTISGYKINMTGVISSDIQAGLKPQNSYTAKVLITK
jgi:hypothetical protein